MVRFSTVQLFSSYHGNPHKFRPTGVVDKMSKICVALHSSEMKHVLVIIIINKTFPELCLNYRVTDIGFLGGGAGFSRVKKCQYYILADIFTYIN